VLLVPAAFGGMVQRPAAGRGCGSFPAPFLWETRSNHGWPWQEPEKPSGTQLEVDAEPETFGPRLRARAPAAAVVCGRRR